MRFLFLAALFALAAPAASSTVAEQPLLLGPICHGEAEPSIPGPHKLVMLPGMGNDHMVADTHNPDAQRWFDYGLTLGRSFQHADAVLAFQRAEQADPACSLCVFGEAWASGRNINFGPGADATPRLLALAKKAQGLAAPDAAAPIKPLETALVDRYGADGDKAWAKDLDALQRAHPDDVEIAIWDAEAWLILEEDGDPSGPTRAIQVLGPLLPAHADSSGLVHFYVHATENAGVPELAAPYAGALATLAPSASHMVHMPSHTWFRVGRYEEAAQANVDALNVDRAYAEKTDFPTPLGKVPYHGHDVSFGLAGAMMSGDGEIALTLVAQYNQDFPNPAGLKGYGEIGAGQTFAALGRFGAPAKVLSTPDTVASKPYLEAMRHYARGLAYLRLGRASDARAEADKVTLPMFDFASGGPAKMRRALTDIARLTLQGDADLLDGRPDAAIAPFTTAATTQAVSIGAGGDPPDWWYPVRRSLAAALFAKGDAAGAEREASAVLQTWKLDPVALLIRSKAERALGHGGADQDLAAARLGWHGAAPALDAAAKA